LLPAFCEVFGRIPTKSFKINKGRWKLTPPRSATSYELL
jgi:hypothetical protein